MVCQLDDAMDELRQWQQGLTSLNSILTKINIALGMHFIIHKNESAV